VREGGAEKHIVPLGDRSLVSNVVPAVGDIAGQIRVGIDTVAGADARLGPWSIHTIRGQ
jgi:hypothetical protein